MTSPWLRIWFRPTSAMLHLEARGAKYDFALPSILFGFVMILSHASENNWGDRFELPVIYLLILLIGPLLGLFWVYAMTFTIRILSKNEPSFESLRRAVAFGSLPVSYLLILLVPLTLSMGSLMFITDTLPQLMHHSPFKTGFLVGSAPIFILLGFVTTFSSIHGTTACIAVASQCGKPLAFFRLVVAFLLVTVIMVSVGFLVVWVKVLTQGF